MTIENLESREETVARIKEILDGRTTSEPLSTRKQIMYEIQETLTNCISPVEMQDYYDKVEGKL
jgi:hypothetical protein